jgi:hypothetical protein
MEAHMLQHDTEPYAVVTVTREVALTADQIWPDIGGFFDLDRWLDVSCTAVAGEGGLGSVRRIGDEIFEALIAKTRYSYSYVQTDGPMAPYCYHGTVACEPRGAEQAEIIYSLIYDQSDMDQERRASEQTRLKSRFGAAINAMLCAVQS